SQFGKPFNDIKSKIIVNNPNAKPPTADDGCAPLTKNVTGAIVIFQLGADCGSKDRCGNARAAGAIGCLIYNNNPGDTSIYGDAKIPGGGLSREDGLAILALVKSKSNTVFDFPSKQQLVNSSTAGTPSSFTSWAMDPELQVKPNIAGIGGNVY